MAWGENFHSRLVSWMKIILPLAALALLSTLFLISRTVDPTQEPVTDIDLERRALEQGATRPRFAGMTRTGDQVSFVADSARPDPDDPERLIAREVSAVIVLKQGNRVTISAERADMHQTRLTAMLEGAVEVATADGYLIATDRIDMRYDTLLAETPGPVEGVGPPGHITAGKMRISRVDGSDNAELLFTDGVKLIYTPQNSKD